MTEFISESTDFKLSGDLERIPNNKRKDISDFRRILEQIARKKSSLIEVFSNFTCLAACALALETREEEYLEIAGKYSKDDLTLFSQAFAALVVEMERKPFTDLLGVYYNEIGSKFSRDLGGEFYTPKPVSDFMTRIIVDIEQAIQDNKRLVVNDPACGAGGMILSLAEHFENARTKDLNPVNLIRATCQDISKTACDMTYINTSLWGIPAKIIWGDTLANTAKQVWRNVHWARVGETDRERIDQWMSALKALKTPQQSKQQVEPSQKPIIHEVKEGQIEWRFE